MVFFNCGVLQYAGHIAHDSLLSMINMVPGSYSLMDGRPRIASLERTIGSIAPTTKTTMDRFPGRDRFRDLQAERKQEALDKLEDEIHDLETDLRYYRTEQAAAGRHYVPPGLIRRIEAEIAQKRNQWQQRSQQARLARDESALC
jgi:hypothetical protein